MSKDKDIEILNMYETAAKKYAHKSIQYKNLSKIQISLPTRMLVIGTSGSGKTNLVVNLIRIFGCFSYLSFRSKSRRITLSLFTRLVQ